MCQSSCIRDTQSKFYPTTITRDCDWLLELVGSNVFGPGFFDLTWQPIRRYEILFSYYCIRRLAYAIFPRPSYKNQVRIGCYFYSKFCWISPGLIRRTLLITSRLKMISGPEFQLIAVNGRSAVFWAFAYFLQNIGHKRFFFANQRIIEQINSQIGHSIETGLVMVKRQI
jgi:hypothetical protein